MLKIHLSPDVLNIMTNKKFKWTELEVTNISAHGVWLLVDDKELFMQYAEFPWFRNATVAQIIDVEEPQKGHFYWPKLDVDLTVDIIEHPERYPLKAKVDQSS
jgi:hypothetical protein